MKVQDLLTKAKIKKCKMRKIIIEKINACLEDEDVYSKIEKHLHYLLAKGKLKQKVILEILRLKNYLFISDFLIKYNFFDKEDLTLIRSYIIDNLDNTERLFVSDLLEFATYWNLELPYEKCLSFLDKYENDNHFVLLASMEYIFKNLKFEYIEQIVEKLISIIDNANQIQTAQVNASFILFRITLKKEYLSNLIELVMNNDHKILLRNILNLEYNNQKYFDYHDLLMDVCN
jgi:hypothetical protein